MFWRGLSPYAKQGQDNGHVSLRHFNPGSILKFIEQTFSLLPLGQLACEPSYGSGYGSGSGSNCERGYTDATANSIDYVFDWTRSPRGRSRPSRYRQSTTMRSSSTDVGPRACRSDPCPGGPCLDLVTDVSTGQVDQGIPNILRTMSNRRIRGFALLAASLGGAGCSMGSLRTDETPGAPAIVQKTAEPERSAPSFLYVGGSKLSMYALGSTTPLHSTDVSGVSRAALALDSHGDLCEANGNPSYPAIYAFNARTLQLKGTRDGAGFGVLVANRSGYLYEASGGAYLLVFAPGCEHAVKAINNCICQELLFDQSGNLYAGEGGVRIYAPTQKPWRMKFVRAIHDGIDGAGALAVGPSGELFVASDYGRRSVSVFAPGGSKPIRRITKGLDYPGQLAVDSKGRLYVANRPLPPTRSSVSVYAPGGTQPIRKISGSNFNPTALAVDAADNLYVASANDVKGSYVDVYSPGGAKLLRTITKGVSLPTGLLIGSP